MSDRREWTHKDFLDALDYVLAESAESIIDEYGDKPLDNVRSYAAALRARGAAAHPYRRA